MTRRSSVRAQARRNYCDLAAGQRKSAPTPDPSPRVATARGGGEQRRFETALTKRVRRLYEDSAVPVREIAAIIGVAERTIYKYVEKHGWKKRYRVFPGRGLARGQQAVRGDCAPVTGAGGRFIRREDKDKPVAVGLKATDPAGASRAAARCGGAAHLSALAQARAQEAQRFEQQNRANDAVNVALKNLREHREERVRKGRSAADDRIEPMLMQVVAMSLEHWTALLRAETARA